MIKFEWKEKRLTLSRKMLGGVLIYFLLTVIPVARMSVGVFKTAFNWGADNLGWMYWTLPSGIFFGGLFLTIIGMAIWDEIQPNVNRKGFLPVETSRGDRLFIGIMSTIVIHLLWLLILGLKFLWGAVILSVIWFYIEARWG